MKPTKDNTFCWYPFHRLAIKEWKDGKISLPVPCCVSQNTQNDPMGWESWKHEIENAPGNKIKNIFNHRAFEQLRRDAMTNVKNPACKTCWQREAEVGTSDRLKYSPDGEQYTKSMNNLQVTSYDIQISDECNLRCRMCTPWLSNKLRTDVKLFKQYDLELPTGWRYEKNYLKPTSQNEVLTEASQSEWKHLLDNLNTCEHIKFTGGEVFVSKRFKEFLDYAIETNHAQHIDLRVITNATKFTNEVIEKIKHFRNFGPVFSIDGIGKTYEYIRHPMPFEKLQKSVTNFAKSDLKCDVISHAFVLSVYNLHNVYDYLEYYKNFYKDYSKFKKLYFSFDFVHPYEGPLACKWLPNNILKTVADQLSTVDDPTLNEIKQYLYNAQQVDDNDKQHMWHKMKTNIDNFDTVRQQSYVDYLHPQMIEFLNSIKQ